MNENQCRKCGGSVDLDVHNYTSCYSRLSGDEVILYTHYECMEPFAYGDDFKKWVIYMIKEMRSELGFLSERIDEIGR